MLSLLKQHFRYPLKYLRYKIARPGEPVNIAYAGSTVTIRKASTDFKVLKWILDRGELAVVKEFLSSSYRKKKGLVVDAGANIGVIREY